MTTAGEALDVKQSEQDDAISSLKTAVESQSASLSAISKKHEQDTVEINAALESITARLDALEAGEPTDPTDPEHSTPTVYYTTDGETLLPLSSETLPVTGPFNLCLLDEDTSGPVSFSWDGGGKTESQSAFCIFGGNDAPFPLSEWPAGERSVEITGPDFDPLAVKVVVKSDAPPPSGDGASKLQVGYWFSWYSNPEQYYTNYFSMEAPQWKQYDRDWNIVSTLQDLIDRGVINPDTGLPNATDEPVDGPFIFKGNAIEQFDGEWILEWEGEADFILQYQPDELKRREGNRIYFTRDTAGGRTTGHVFLRIRNIQSDITAIRLFRAEDEGAGVYRPAVLAASEHYDIIRTMDLQSANHERITRADQIPPADYLFNGFNADFLKYQTPPLERVFALGIESGKALWVHAPLRLGNFEGATAEQVINSDEWDKYAARFISALETSGYPKDRALYVTISNEIWNFANPFAFNTSYAKDIGNELYGGDWRYREGYGVLLSRLATAILAAGGDAYDITFVFEGQAANTQTTRAALTAAKDWLESNGYSWADHSPRFGASVASYWGAYPVHLERDGVDPNDLDALENWFINGPKESISTLAWNLDRWRAHKAEADKFNVPLIGAYEGGTHFERPPNMEWDKFREFGWGERGARVNTVFHEKMREAFPGAILTNYVLAGPTGGQPWFEGPVGAKTPMNDSWMMLSQEN